MPRKPKAENANNRLRQLRALLSKDGESAPITQSELSRVCDIPLNTIRSIEAGRRKLTLPAVKKIERATAGKWNPELASWTIYDSEKLLTFSWYSVYRSFSRQRPPNYQRRIRFVHRKIDALFDKIPGHSWNVLLCRINDFLEECRQDFNLKGLDDVFSEAKTQFELMLDFAKAQNLKPIYLDSEPTSPNKRTKRGPRPTTSPTVSRKGPFPYAGRAREITLSRASKGTTAAP
jgi:hypothetical protein